jgi:hypothetical protein
MAALLSGFLSEVSFSPRAKRESSSVSPQITGKEANQGATTAGVTRGLAVLRAYALQGCCNAPHLSSGHERSAVAAVVLLFKWPRRLVAE